MKARAKGERPADLLFWFRDGCCGQWQARAAADTEVSIGRTNSKRALGFIVMNGKGEKKRTVIDFVLDRDQVAELAVFLKDSLGRLRKPLGKKRPHLSLVQMSLPKVRLRKALENAAVAAHPGWHRIGENDLEADPGAPEGAKLIAWFKRTHPRAAARIEQEFTKRLWEGAS